MKSSSSSIRSQHTLASPSSPPPKSELHQEHPPPSRTKVTHFDLIRDQSLVTPEVLNHTYPGSGTQEDPYRIEFIPHDPRNPKTWKKQKKWVITMTCAIATLAIAFVSSAFTGGVEQMMQAFGVGSEVITLGVSLFVLGFAIGPLLWAPLSELYGRQILFVTTYAGVTAFNAGAAGSQNIQTLIVLRFFAGAIGSSPLTNAGGVIADMFDANERGLAIAIFSAAPFLGPTLGPIVGGFLGQNEGWRWVEGIMAIFTGTLWIIGTLVIPETYAPVLLRRRAAKLSQMTGRVYLSQLDYDRGRQTFSQTMKTALSRPWILLIKEPIVFALSLYMAIIYGTLYMCFGAFPIVFQEERGWSEGVGALPFISVAIGMMIGILYVIFYENDRYVRAATKAGGRAPPEQRLNPAMVSCLTLPVGLFWFAWTNSPSIHWSVCVIATAPFGFGMVLVFLSITNYLIDSYVIYAASVLAANSVLRSLFGAAFPLFTTYMYQNLGIHWASTIPAFLSLACVPFPFLFYRYGPAIRMRCKYAAEAERFLMDIQAEKEPEPETVEGKDADTDRDTLKEKEDVDRDVEKGLPAETRA